MDPDLLLLLPLPIAKKFFWRQNLIKFFSEVVLVVQSCKRSRCTPTILDVKAHCSVAGDYIGGFCDHCQAPITRVLASGYQKGQSNQFVRWTFFLFQIEPCWNSQRPIFERAILMILQCQSLCLGCINEPGLARLLSRAKPDTLDNYSAWPDVSLWPLGLVLTLIQPSITTKWEHE